MKKICIYCGSSPGARPEYIETAEKLGRLLVQKKIDLVYGGARVGVMAAIANAVLGHGGEVIGVMPRFLTEKEVAHTGLTELRTVETMHERKKLMTELADGFIALPGGMGTLDELFETLTWAQLGLHQKPIGLLNVCSYYDFLLQFLENGAEERFLSQAHRDMLIVENDAAKLLARLEGYRAQQTEKWLDLDLI